MDPKVPFLNVSSTARLVLQYLDRYRLIFLYIPSDIHFFFQPPRPKLQLHPLELFPQMVGKRRPMEISSKILSLLRQHHLRDPTDNDFEREVSTG